MDANRHIDEAIDGWARVVPDLDVETMRTALLLARATMLGRKHLEAAFVDVGLSSGEFDVLASLLHLPGRASTPSVLARSGMLSPAGMTHRLDRLERGGYIERRPDPNDRRSTVVVLTAVGESKAIEAARAHVEVEREMFAVLEPEQRADLRGLLETLLAAYSTVDSRPNSDN